MIINSIIKTNVIWHQQDVTTSIFQDYRDFVSSSKYQNWQAKQPSIVVGQLIYAADVITWLKIIVSPFWNKESNVAISCKRNIYLRGIQILTRLISKRITDTHVRTYTQLTY